MQDFDFYALRYLPEVPLKERKHAATVGRFETWLDAEDARAASAKAHQLEVVTRRLPS